MKRFEYNSRSVVVRPTLPLKQNMDLPSGILDHSWLEVSQRYGSRTRAHVLFPSWLRDSEAQLGRREPVFLLRVSIRARLSRDRARLREEFVDFGV